MENPGKNGRSRICPCYKKDPKRDDLVFQSRPINTLGVRHLGNQFFVIQPIFLGSRHTGLHYEWSIQRLLIWKHAVLYVLRRLMISLLSSICLTVALSPNYNNLFVSWISLDFEFGVSAMSMKWFIFGPRQRSSQEVEYFGVEYVRKQVSRYRKRGRSWTRKASQANKNRFKHSLYRHPFLECFTKLVVSAFESTKGIPETGLPNEF